ncbi:hypothetical protein [Aliterella atlantica]|uniref:hypothetical protein n=1 Tax=Aliterella atlantica TaxID=1827278 RepID=UPI00136490A5
MMGISSRKVAIKLRTLAVIMLHLSRYQWTVLLAAWLWCGFDAFNRSNQIPFF